MPHPSGTLAGARPRLELRGIEMASGRFETELGIDCRHERTRLFDAHQRRTRLGWVVLRLAGGDPIDPSIDPVAIVFGECSRRASRNARGNVRVCGSRQRGDALDPDVESLSGSGKPSSTPPSAGPPRSRCLQPERLDGEPAVTAAVVATTRVVVIAERVVTAPLDGAEHGRARLRAPRGIAAALAADGRSSFRPGAANLACRSAP